MEKLSSTPDRRTFLLQSVALWQAAATLSAQHVHRAPATVSAPYQFLFLKPTERATVQAFAARIVPADERSGGAVAARVEEYIDFVLAHADANLKRTWHRGLAQYGAAVPAKTPEALDAFLARQCEREFAPQSEEQIFFVLLKKAVVEGFYTSEEGINKELGYKGMGFILDWQGCTHAHHEAPAGWQPSLRVPETGEL